MGFSVVNVSKEQMNGLLALVAVQLCFGLFPLFAKWAFEGDAFSPASVAAYRIVAGIFVLGSFAIGLYGRKALPRGADIPRLFLCAMFGVVVNQGLFLEGVARTTSINTGLIICLIPVFTYLIAILAGQERLRGKRCLGIGVAMVATAMLFLERGEGQVGGHLLGNLLVLLNVASYSLYLVISKPLTARYPPLVIIAWVYAFSAVSLPYFVWGERLVPPLAGAERAWWSLGFILLFPTVLGYLLNIYALARVRASTTALFTYLQPVMTGLAGILLLSESLTMGAVLAGCGLFSGLWLARSD